MRERRKVPRYPLGAAGSLHLARGGFGADVVVGVISTLGCAIERAKGASVGKKCELYFDWRGVQIGLEAQVVWSDAQGRMGLKFRSVDKDTQKRLNELCATLGSQPLPVPPPDKADTARSVLDFTTARQPARPAAPPVAAPSPPHRLGGKSERRQVPRYVSELRARLSIPSTGATWSVALVTLSILGGCLEGSGLPQAGQKCELNTEWEGKRLLIQGEVVWKGKEQVGMKFASLEERAEKLLRQICANLRLQPLAPIPTEPE